MQLVRPLDGDRIELERLVHHFRVPGRLGHTGSLNPLLVVQARSEYFSNGNERHF